MEKIPRLNRVSGKSDIPQERKVAEMIRVPAMDPIVGIVVCDAIFSLPTHFANGRTRICTEKPDCEYCGTVPMKWYGLIAVWGRNDHQAKWVQLTSSAAGMLLSALEERQLPLHGLSVRICRERKVKNAPIVIAIDEYARVPERLPKPMDPQETIERVFGKTSSPRSNGRKAV